MDKPAAVPELTKQSPYEVEVTAPSLTGVHTIQTMNRPAANQVSKSAEQVADAVSGTDEHIRYIGMKAEVDALLEYLGGPTCYPGTEWGRTLVDEVKAHVSSQTASAASPVAGVSEPDAVKCLREIQALLKTGKCLFIGNSIRKQIDEILAQPSAEGDGWIAEPTEQGWWWHADDPDAKPFMYGIMQSGTNGKMFIQYPDSRWCSDVGGLWAKATPPPLPTPPSVQEEKGSSE